MEVKQRKTWRVTIGSSTRTYFTEHHAEQFACALRLNGTPCTVTESQIHSDQGQSIDPCEFCGDELVAGLCSNCDDDEALYA